MDESTGEKEKPVGIELTVTSTYFNRRMMRASCQFTTTIISSRNQTGKLMRIPCGMKGVNENAI